jgi:hypothetical protein
MRNLIRRFQSCWLADASFVTLLITLIAAVFVLPVTTATGERLIKSSSRGPKGRGDPEIGFNSTAGIASLRSQ